MIVEGANESDGGIAGFVVIREGNFQRYYLSLLLLHTLAAEPPVPGDAEKLVVGVALA